MLDVASTSVETNWDEQLAKLTTTDGDFSKGCFELFSGTEVHKKTLNALAKLAPFKDLIAKAAGELDASAGGSASAQGTGSASSSAGAGASSRKTPQSQKKRGLKRNLSEVSVPSDLKAAIASE